MREFLKKFLFKSADTLKLPSLYLKFRRPTATIALYHGVSPDSGVNGIFNYRKKFINPKNFREQLFWLKSHFKITSLSNLIKLIEKEKSLTDNLLAITFDDGYENIYSHAYPILKEMGIPATVFLTTDLVENRYPLWVDRLEYSIGNSALSELNLKIGEKISSLPTETRLNKQKTDSVLREYLKNVENEKKEGLLAEIEAQTGKKLIENFENSPYTGLSWEQINEMSKNNIDFAPHTKSHPILSKTEKKAALLEITESYRICSQRIGRTLKIFAYPNGQEKDFNPEIKNILKSERFEAALTTVPGIIKPGFDLYSLPRFSLDGSDDLAFFRITISGIRSHFQLIRDLLHIKTVDPGEFFNKGVNEYLAEYYKETPEGFSFRERKRLTLDMLTKVEGKSILDIGSGPGVIIKELLERGAKITAIDIAPNMIELLKERFHNQNLSVKVGNIENIDSPDNAYDYLTALGVLEYLDSDEKALSEIKRVLKKDGEAIISFPNYFSPWRIWNKILLATIGLPWRLFKNLSGKNRHPVRHREYTKKQIKEILTEAGLETEEIVGYNFKLVPLPLDRFFPKTTVRLSGLFKNFGRSKLNWLATAYLVKAKNS